jgi:hypothetical protein
MLLSLIFNGLVKTVAQMLPKNTRFIFVVIENNPNKEGKNPVLIASDLDSHAAVKDVLNVVNSTIDKVTLNPKNN